MSRLSWASQPSVRCRSAPLPLPLPWLVRELSPAQLSTRQLKVKDRPLCGPSVLEEKPRNLVGGAAVRTESIL